MPLLYYTGTPPTVLTPHIRPGASTSIAIIWDERLGASAILSAVVVPQGGAVSNVTPDAPVTFEGVTYQHATSFEYEAPLEEGYYQVVITITVDLGPPHTIECFVHVNDELP